MASHDDDHSDYGSDLSPDEQALVEKLLAVAIPDIEDIGNFNNQNAPQAACPSRLGQSCETPDEDDDSIAKIAEPNLASAQESKTIILFLHEFLPTD